jgi:hypothetical protein
MPLGILIARVTRFERTDTKKKFDQGLSLKASAARDETNMAPWRLYWIMSLAAPDRGVQVETSLTCHG